MESSASSACRRSIKFHRQRPTHDDEGLPRIGLDTSNLNDRSQRPVKTLSTKKATALNGCFTIFFSVPSVISVVDNFFLKSSSNDGIVGIVHV